MQLFEPQLLWRAAQLGSAATSKPYNFLHVPQASAGTLLMPARAASSVADSRHGAVEVDSSRGVVAVEVEAEVEVGVGVEAARRHVQVGRPPRADYMYISF